MRRPRGTLIGTFLVGGFVLVAILSIAMGRLGWLPFPHVKAQTPSQQNPQTAPTQNPQAKPGATIVINPTEAECKAGWRPGLRWTQEQFAGFCAQLQSSK